jgi:SAM-dependent methyltransferase
MSARHFLAHRDPAGDAPIAIEGSDLRIVTDSRWGYRRVDPLPDESDLDRFYESHYRDAIDATGRGQGLARLVKGGADAERERDWLAATLHADVRDALEGAAADGLPRRALDVGCGTGDLLSDLAGAGWAMIGTEPATEIADVGRARGLLIEPVTGAAFIDSWRARSEQPYSGITLMNVLEHVPEPAELLQTLSEALAPGGRFVARVPNDFSAIQLAAQQALGREPWWIAIPDHVNYFTAESFAGLFERLGFEIVDVMADFPMELFLLMGDDYVGDRSVGGVVHERRRRLELSLPADLRRTLGRAWIRAGIGRNVMVVARRPISRR